MLLASTVSQSDGGKLSRGTVRARDLQLFDLFGALEPKKDIGPLSTGHRPGLG